MVEIKTLISYGLGALTGKVFSDYVWRNKRRLSVGLAMTLTAGYIAIYGARDVVPKVIDNNHIENMTRDRNAFVLDSLRESERQKKLEYQSHADSSSFQKLGGMIIQGQYFSKIGFDDLSSRLGKSYALEKKNNSLIGRVAQTTSSIENHVGEMANVSRANQSLAAGPYVNAGDHK